MLNDRILKQLIIQNLNTGIMRRYIEEIKTNLNEIGLVIENAFDKSEIKSTLKSQWFYSEKTERHTVEVIDEIWKQISDRIKKYWQPKGWTNSCVTSDIRKTLETYWLSRPMWPQKKEEMTRSNGYLRIIDTKIY